MIPVQAMTEGTLAEASGLDTWDDAKILEFLVAGQQRAIAAVTSASPAIAEAASRVAERLRQGGKLYYAGAGSSIRIGALDGSELHSTFGLSESSVGFLIAGGREALVRTADAAEDDEQAGSQAAVNCTAADVLLAIAASGRTPYTIAAAQTAKAKGCLVITLANNSNAPLSACGDIAIVLPSGAEAISGSTRLAAGTAQKVALNLLSTLTFIKLGAVHDGYMVDVIPGNRKLRERARNIVTAIAGCGDAAAASALEQSGGSVKVAVLLCVGAADSAAAQDLLKDSGNNLRVAMSRLQQQR
jgi:N-acetylmuramic acid 6-phosphate etherase